MKIAGLTYYEGKKHMYLKPDTALLVNKKPFFLPHFSEQIKAHPAVVARIDRMGRCIAEKFAARYYSQVAPAINFMAQLKNGENSLDEWTRSVVFDNSMAVGVFDDYDNLEAQWNYNGTAISTNSLIEDINKAIALVSSYITLRTGDLVAVDYMTEPIEIKRNDEFEVNVGDEERLFCRIK